MKDGPYLLVVLFFVSVVLSVLFRVAWRTLGRPEHARTWSLAFAVGAVGYLLNALGAVPRLANPLYVVLVSVPTVIVSYLGTLGYRQRAGLPTRRLWFGLAIGLTVASILWFNFVMRNDPLRIAVVPLFGAAMLFLAAKAVAGQASCRDVPDRLAWWFLVAFGSFELVLFGLSLRLGPKDHAAALLAYNTTLLLGVPSLYVANGLVGMFVLTSDLARRMETLAVTDTLTGLLNRRGIEREAAEGIATARREGSRLAVVLADLDHFKRINDEHGHGVGDVALARFSDYLAKSSPAATRVGRLGGEEFILLIAALDELAVTEGMERVRGGVAGISLAEYEVPPFTASFGITFLEDGDQSLGDLLRRADLALYQAKQTGRNRVCLYDESQTPLHVPRSSRRIAPRL
jgi:diguanylate cyclase (GGDEF)-like protein